MTIPALPAKGSREWYDHYTALDAVARAIPSTYGDLSGQVPASALPSLAIVDYLGAVSTEAAMLALVGQRGDWCTRTDRGGAVWQLVADTPAQLASWVEHTLPASGVSSVNGRSGNVTGLAESASLAPVATSGSAADLTTGVLDDARIRPILGALSVRHRAGTPRLSVAPGDWTVYRGQRCHHQFARL